MRGAGVGIDIAGAVQSIVGREYVRTGEQVRPYRLGEMAPQAVALPGDEEEVSKILALAWGEGLRVAPWGSGLHQTIGDAPEGYDLALDLGRMNRVLEHEPGDMTATAQCGIRMADLQAYVGRSGQLLPLDPSLAERATLGGILATNLSGPLRCRYGTARDLVLGIRVVHADGTVTKGGAKVVKNATAYDITKLYLGSHGTLGLIVAASLRVYPRPSTEEGWECTPSDLPCGQALATQILASHCVPTRVELAQRGDGRMSLFVSCAGIAEAVQVQAGEFRRMAEEHGTAFRPMADAVQAWRGLSDFPWVPPAGEGGMPRAIWRAGVLPSACAQGMLEIRRSVGARGAVSMAATVAAGAIRGAVSARSAAELASCLLAAREAVAGLQGFLVVLDAPVETRARVEVWGPAPEGLAVMRRLKEAFDSRRILNPGRFVGAI